MNKMFKKLMAVSATVAIAATMSVSAFAADANYNAETGSVSVDTNTLYTGVKGANQYTVMVYAADFDGTDTNDIYYINQNSDYKALLADMLVKSTTTDNEISYLPDGDYIVKIGNDGGADPAVFNLNVTTEVVETKDYITATEAGKATVNTLSAAASGWLFDGMASRVTIALDATAYSDFTQDETTGLYTKNYTITPVKADGTAVDGAEVYFSAQTGKYVVLIPSGAEAGYKYEVTAGANTNTVLGLYGDANANNKVDGTDKTIVAGLVSGKNTNATFTSTNQRKLRLDINGDGKLNATDKTVLAGVASGKISTPPVFSK